MRAGGGPFDHKFQQCYVKGLKEFIKLNSKSVGKLISENEGEQEVVEDVQEETRIVSRSD